MRVLVACEFSGTVRDAFIREGFDAISCDILPSDSDFGPHHQGDVKKFLCDEGFRFDLMIAHPPCTYLANSGVRWLWNKDKTINQERWKDMHEAADFFRWLTQVPIRHKAIENPIMHKHARSAIGIDLDPQYVQPWMFGHEETKNTGFWLYNLPPLVATKVMKTRYPRVHREPPSKDRWKKRSLTYKGIADAMAKQWGDYIREKAGEA